MHIQIVQFPICTPAHLHTSAPAHLHTCTRAQLHTCAVANLQKMQTCTHTHLHTCSCARVQLFLFLRPLCVSAAHVYMSKHGASCHFTSHRVICNGADPRDTLVAEITHTCTHPSVSHHKSQSCNNSVRRQHRTAQRARSSYHTILSKHITPHKTSNIPCSACIAYIKEPKRSRYRNRHTRTQHMTGHKPSWIWTLLMTKQLVWAPEPVPETFESPNHWTPEPPPELFNFHHLLNPNIFTPLNNVEHLCTWTPKPQTAFRTNIRSSCWVLAGFDRPGDVQHEDQVKPKGGVRATILQCDGLQGLPASIWFQLGGWRRRVMRREGGANTDRFLRRRRRRFRQKWREPRTKTSQRSTTAHAPHTNIILHHIQNFLVIKVSTAQQRVTHPKKHVSVIFRTMKTPNFHNLSGSSVLRFRVSGFRVQCSVEILRFRVSKFMVFVFSVARLQHSAQRTRCSLQAAQAVSLWVGQSQWNSMCGVPRALRLPSTSSSKTRRWIDFAQFVFPN